MPTTTSKLLGACVAALLASTLAPRARAQSCEQQLKIFTDDVGGAKLLPTTVSALTAPGRSETRLQYLAVLPSGWDIKEVSGDRGTAQRKVTASCATPPVFDATKTTNVRLFEEQTAYYWSQASRAYAKRALWITPPGWPLGAIKMAKEGVQPNVVTQGSFDSACFPIGSMADGCMRVWPQEGPKIHLKTGVVTPGLVTHEYGHYAAGYVFGHMDVFGFSLPAALGDCAKLAFQEAAANMFSFLVLHDGRYEAGPEPYAKVDATRLDRWPVTCGDPKQAYDVARPLQQAFLQALWGHDPASTIKVDWGAVPGANMPADPKLANRTMANAFVYGLALNRGQRVDALASSVLEWLTVNEPRRVGPIRRIFAAHGLVPRPNGEICVSHAECMSFRCDNRPGAGCVSQDGMAAPGQICTTHQQCQNGVCLLTSGIRGTCAVGANLGTACTSHPQCASQRCDNRSGAGCVAQDGTAASGQFCTTHQQCRSGYCVTAGRISGTCR